MPNYEMTATEYQQYGDSLNIWQAIRLLTTWQPLVAYGQRFVAEADPYKKGLIAVEACEWLAAKTDAKLDDQLAKLVSDVLRTKEGEQLVRFALSLAGVK